MWSSIGRKLIQAAIWACGHKEVVAIVETIIKNKGQINVKDLPPGILPS